MGGRSVGHPRKPRPSVRMGSRSMSCSATLGARSQKLPATGRRWICGTAGVGCRTCLGDLTATCTARRNRKAGHLGTVAAWRPTRHISCGDRRGRTARLDGSGPKLEWPQLTQPARLRLRCRQQSISCASLQRMIRLLLRRCLGSGMWRSCQSALSILIRPPR